MGKSSPQPPDPVQSAAAQEKYGEAAATYNKALNATNEVGPTGSTTNAITGYDPRTGAPQYTQTTNLTAPEQQLLAGEQQGGLAEQNLALDTLFGTPNSPLISIDRSSIPPLQTSLDTSGVSALPSQSDIQGINRDATGSVLRAGEAAMDPMLTAQFNALHSSLVNSGNGPGTPAYETAMSQFMAQEGGQFAQLEGTATTAGSQVGATTYGEEAGANQQGFTEALQRMTAENQARGMSESDALQAAQAQLAQRTGVAGLASNLYASAAPTIPSASGIAPASTAAPNYMQALQNAYQGQVASYNAQTGSTDALIGDAALIAAAFASDRLLKRDLERVGATPAGLPVYRFRYLWDRADLPKRLGVLAQDVLVRFPAAVCRGAFGFLYVNYTAIG